MAEPARQTSVANKALAEKLLPEKSSAKKVVPGEEEAAVEASKPTGRRRVIAWMARHPSRGVLLILLGLSLMLNGLVVWYFGRNHEVSHGPRGALEVDLGNFTYHNPEPTENALQEARFSLAVALRDDLDAPTRENLETHRRRVQQAVEELLRRARDDDFADPDLSGLKRRLREQITGVLGVRGIAEVVITELVTSRPLPLGGNSEGATAFSAPPQGGSR